MDHRAKLEWARNHLNSLDEAIGVFIKSEPYELKAKYDRETGDYIAWIKVVKTLPPEWGLMLGDIVHNTRSSLDALAYALARKNLGKEPTEAEAKATQFVIVDNPEQWPGESGKWLRHVSAEARLLIDSYQPCHRRDHSQRHALSVLRDLSNIDKHRHVLLTLASATSSSIELVGPHIAARTVVSGYVGPIQTHTVVARWRFLDGVVPVHPKLGAEVNAQGKLGLDIQFAESRATPKGGSVLPYLKGVQQFIRARIFPAFDNFI